MRTKTSRQLVAKMIEQTNLKQYTMAENVTTPKQSGADQFLDKAGVLTLIEWLRNRGCVIEEIYPKEEGGKEPDYSVLEDGQVYIFNNNIYKFDLSKSDGEKNENAFICLTGVFLEDFRGTCTTGMWELKADGFTDLIPVKGQTPEQAIHTIFCQPKGPTVDQPSFASFTMYNGDARAVDVEVGTSVTLGYKNIYSTFSAGAYHSVPTKTEPTGVTASNARVKLIKGSSTQVQTIKTLETDSYETLVVGDGDSYKLTATIDYSDSPNIPVNNLGTPVPEKKIVGKTNVSANSQTINGYRIAFFGQIDTNATINSAFLRSLPDSMKFRSSAKTFNAYKPTADQSKRRLILAAPKGTLKVTKALNVTSNAFFQDQFLKQTEVLVEGANGYTAAAYDVYLFSVDEWKGGETYNITIG